VITNLGRPILQPALLVGGLAAVLLAVPTTATAQDAEGYFRQNCMSCHTIGGGRLTGPDLKDVNERRTAEWLARYIPNPQAMINSGDPYAAQLLRDARGVIMPPPPRITPDMVQALLTLIEAESLLEESQFVGLQVSDRPFTAIDVDLGLQLFLGNTHLASGGPPCINCHTVRDLGGLGGGRLGPDLTTAYERLQGRTSLASWLTMPATPTMQMLFASPSSALDPEEILSLVAYLEASAQKGGEDTAPNRMIFLLFGLSGTAVALVLFDVAWKRRFRAARRPMVRGEED